MTSVEGINEIRPKSAGKGSPMREVSLDLRSEEREEPRKILFHAKGRKMLFGSQDVAKVKKQCP